MLSYEALSQKFDILIDKSVQIFTKMLISLFRSHAYPWSSVKYDYKYPHLTSIDTSSLVRKDLNRKQKTYTKSKKVICLALHAQKN